MLTVSEKKDWIDALRSGQYRQIPDVMYDAAGGFCALGVLAHLLGRMQSLDLDDKVCSADYVKISDMNDAGSPFGQIADYIEARIPTAMPDFAIA
jgi:hypothetical protein